jgi:hypothetical protein
MSHFSVLVVGDVDYNMAPFHEFECDGVDDEFIQTIDVTKSLKEDYEKALLKRKMNPEEKYGFKGSTFREFLTEYHGYKVAESEEAIDLEDAHKFGYALLVPGTEDDFQVFDRTNPNKFYDYYGTGYRGLKLKKPTTMMNHRTGEEEETMYTNSALKKEIDFEGTWAECLGKDVLKDDDVELTDVEVAANCLVNLCFISQYPPKFENAHQLLLK